MFASRLDSAHSHREPICRSAAQLFMGRRNEAARTRLNSLSFSNNLGFRTAPPLRYFCSQCMAWRSQPMASGAFKGASKRLAFFTVYFVCCL